MSYIPDPFREERYKEEVKKLKEFKKPKKWSEEELRDLIEKVIREVVFKS